LLRATLSLTFCLNPLNPNERLKAKQTRANPRYSPMDSRFTGRVLVIVGAHLVRA
jgi:hypothetical protein